ncbi:MAG TPA: DUF4139 domain-containing protein [Polyangiaceae bacterium]|nr:DUF4139 domain-containing protein [Polyangiaceae bacterium]
MTRRLGRALSLAALALLSACGGKKVQAPDDGGPVTQRASGSKERESVAVTIYNDNFGLVREERTVALGKGRVELAYEDVSANIEPETVHIKSLSDADELSVLEQNYRYDLLSPDTLLKKYVGKKLKVARYNEKLGTDEIKQAELLAIEGGPVLKIDGEIVVGFPGRFLFPEVPENLLPKPTLVWLLASGLEKQKLEVTYLTRNLSWKADYVLVLSPDDKQGDLAGWVTLENNTGTSYEHAQLKLVAGDVQRVAPPPPPQAPMPESVAMDMAAPTRPQFERESLFEYHLYSLQRPTDLLDKERKQVRLLEAAGITLKKKLILRGFDWYFRQQTGELPPKQKLGVFVEISNSEKNQLGIPLPKGVLRVYKADKSGSRQFVGEDGIDHTPRDEDFEVKLGDAFDVLADRRQMTWKTLGSCGSESTWEIKVKNHKDTAERVELWEPASGEWDIVQSSHKARRENASTFVFEVDVPARGETKVTYTVRVRWC